MRDNGQSGGVNQRGAKLERSLGNPGVTGGSSLREAALSRMPFVASVTDTESADYRLLDARVSLPPQDSSLRSQVPLPTPVAGKVIGADFAGYLSLDFWPKVRPMRAASRSRASCPVTLSPGTSRPAAGGQGCFRVSAGRFVARVFRLLTARARTVSGHGAPKRRCGPAAHAKGGQPSLTRCARATGPHRPLAGKPWPGPTDWRQNGHARLGALVAVTAVALVGCQSPEPVDIVGSSQAAAEDWYCEQGDGSDWACTQDEALVAKTNRPERQAGRHGSSPGQPGATAQRPAAAASASTPDRLSTPDRTPSSTPRPRTAVEGAPATRPSVAQAGRMTTAASASTATQPSRPASATPRPGTPPPTRPAQPMVQPPATPAAPTSASVSPPSEAVMAWPKHYFTVQLLALETAEALDQYLARNGLMALAPAEGNVVAARPDALYRVRSRVGGKFYHVLLLGTYSDRASAENAVASLRPPLDALTPWVRLVGPLQDAMEAAR